MGSPDALSNLEIVLHDDKAFERQAANGASNVESVFSQDSSRVAHIAESPRSASDSGSLAIERERGDDYQLRAAHGRRAAPTEPPRPSAAWSLTVSLSASAWPRTLGPRGWSSRGRPLSPSTALF